MTCRVELTLQALRAGNPDDRRISFAPVVIGAGRRLFERSDESVDLEHINSLPSRFATPITDRVVRGRGRSVPDPTTPLWSDPGEVG